MTVNFLTPIKRNVILADKRTSLQLEHYIWLNLDMIAELTDQPDSAILNQIKRAKQSKSMAQTVRLFCLLFQTNYAENLGKAVNFDPEGWLSVPMQAAEYSLSQQLIKSTFDETLALIHETA